MSKNLKKCLALLLSVVMVLAMSVTVFANPEAGSDSGDGGTDTPKKYSITIQKSKTDNLGEPTKNKYKAYKVADYDVVGEQYVIKSITEAFKLTDGVTKDVDSFEKWLQAETKNPTVEELAVQLAAKVSGDMTGAESDANGKITLTESGYYLVVETEHSEEDASITTKYILEAVDGEKNVYLKTSKPTVEKKIVLEEDSDNVENASAKDTLVDDNVVAIGDTVTYQLKALIPTYSSDVKVDTLKFELKDTLSTGLTFTGITEAFISDNKGNEDGTVVKYNNTADTTDISFVDDLGVTSGDDPYTYTTPATGTAGGEVLIGLPHQVIKDNGGRYVYVTLTATLNENAQVKDTGNPNSVDLTYTNSWDTNGDGKTETTPEDTVITYTGELNIEKVNANDKNVKLPNAKFEIREGSDENGTLLHFIPVMKTEDGNSVVDYYRYAGTTEVKGEDNSTVISTTDLVTNAQGGIKVVGLNKGSYVAIEKEAPRGYVVDDTPQPLTLEVAPAETEKLSNLENKDSNITVPTYTKTDEQTEGQGANEAVKTSFKVKWTLNSSEDSNSAQITNKKGTELPGTGGIGTTIFTFGGLALLILAGAMFVVYTKKQKTQA